MSITHHNYRLPSIHELITQRCRDCSHKAKRDGIGNSITCAHQGGFVRHSHHCDLFKPIAQRPSRTTRLPARTFAVVIDPGTLFQRIEGGHLSMQTAIAEAAEWRADGETADVMHVLPDGSLSTEF